MQRHALVADLSDQKHRFAGRFVQSYGYLVFPKGFLNGLAHLRFHAKKTIRWHAVADPLMWPEMVVMGDEMRKALLGLGKVLGHGSGPELLAHRFPEPLAFAQRLVMMGPGNHMPDALLRQQLLKAAFASPSEILAALVGQDFQGLAPALDAFQQSFLDEFLGLPETQTPRDNVSAVIVQESHEVYFLAIPRQVETGGVALPELAGSGSLKASHQGSLLPVAGSGLVPMR